MHRQIGELISGCKELQSELKGIPDSGHALFLKHYTTTSREYGLRMAKLADILDQEDFDIYEFESNLKESDFRWLKVNLGEIKQHLKGKEL